MSPLFAALALVLASAAPEVPPIEDLPLIREAIAEGERELRRAGSDALEASVSARLVRLHVLAARAEAAAGRREEAVASYGRALAISPDARVPLIELGWLELSLERSRMALVHAERGLVTSPEDPHLLALRAEIAYRDNRLTDALADLERALAANPDDAGLSEKIERVRRELDAERGFNNEHTRHFTLRFDGGRNERLGKLLVDLLEDAYDELADELDAYPREPITVILYPRETFHETTRTPQEVAGLFDGKIRMPVGGVERVTPALERVARHELVHALLHAKGRGRVPRWLHEGLAQRFEPRLAGPWNARLAVEARAGAAIDIEPFSYVTSLSFLDFLEREHGLPRVLWLVELLAEHEPEDLAFRRAFGSSRKEVIGAWRRYLENLR